MVILSSKIFILDKKEVTLSNYLLNWRKLIK